MIRFVPHYQPAIWGGRRMADLFGRALPDGPVGEAWELVEVAGRHSHAVAAAGPHAGRPLGELWRAGVLGGRADGPFPFLLKWIDARQALSVQVHPDEAACASMGRGDPKTEAWYLALPEPDATLLIGHHPGLDAATLRQAATGNTLQKWLFETRPAAGSLYMIEAGTIHAIGAGCLLLEVQQPSDTTYRIYDYGRVGADGRGRALHLDEAAACVHYERHGPPQPQQRGVDGPGFALRLLPGPTSVPAAGLRVLVADAGPVQLRHARGTETLALGDVAVAEQADGTIDLVRGSAVLLGEPADIVRMAGPVASPHPLR